VTASPVSVLILVENLPVPFDRRVWMEATTLRANGYEVAVVCPTGKGFTTRREILDGIRIYRYPLAEADSVVGYFGEYGRALSSSLHMCLKAYRERPFDVIHLCNPPDLLFLVALWFKFGRGVKVIFDHHDVTPEMYLAKYDDRRDLLYRAVVLSERLTFATADIVIATSETGREIAHRRGHKCPGDVFLVRSGPDMARFTPVPPDPALKNGSKHLIGYLGVMGEQEGVDHVIRAAKYIREELGRDDVSFALIGDGPASQDLRALADALGDHPAALMRGHGAAITGPSLPRVVSRTIFLALNATLQVEAMRMGAPITYMDPEEARKIEAREGHGLARAWEGWKHKAMAKP